jgi:hypothetical protein
MRQRLGNGEVPGEEALIMHLGRDDPLARFK